MFTSHNNFRTLRKYHEHKKGIATPMTASFDSRRQEGTLRIHAFFLRHLHFVRICKESNAILIWGTNIWLDTMEEHYFPERGVFSGEAKEWI